MMLLSQAQALSLLKKYSLPYPETIIFKKREELVGKSIRFPVALKIDSAEVLHKTDYGLVFTGIKDMEELSAKISAAQEVLSAKQIKSYNFVVQRMVNGTELIVGMKSDRTFGKVILFGLGGIFVEILKDVSMRISPIEKKDAEHMLDEIKARKLLDGYRKSPAVNRDKVIEVLMGLSRMCSGEKDLVEIDFNPVISNESEAWIVDARIIVGDKDA